MREGPTLCVVGGVHGDEAAGVRAVEELRHRFPGERDLLAGRLVTIVANTRAVRLERRSIDFDLNRAFGAVGLRGHEASLAHPLSAAISGADFVLDLHSTSAESPAFGAGAESLRHSEFCGAVGVDLYSFGWSEPRGHTMLIDQADRQGAVGLLVECGQHDRERTASTALSCAVRAMAWLGLTAERGLRRVPCRGPRTARVVEIVKAVDEPLRMSGAFRNFEAVTEGTEVCRGGTASWIAPRDFVILIPARRTVGTGEDAFAVGVWDEPDRARQQRG